MKRAEEKYKKMRTGKLKNLGKKLCSVDDQSDLTALFPDSILLEKTVDASLRSQVQ